MDDGATFATELSHGGFVVTTRYDGAPSFDTVLRAGRDRLDASTPTTRVHVADYSRASMERLSSEDIHRLVEGSEANTKRIPSFVFIALVPTDLEFGLARMFQSLVDQAPFDAHVVRSAEEVATIVSGLRAGSEEAD